MSGTSARGLEQEFAVVVSCLMAGRMSGPQAVASLTAIASPALDAIVAERVAALAEEFATGAWLDAFMTGEVHDDESAVRAVERWFLGRVGLTERRPSDG